MATSGSRIAIAYDGSASAATAIRAATRLFGSARAFIATVADHTTVSVGTAMPMVPGVSPAAVQRMIEELDAEARREVDALAQRAVDRVKGDGREAEVASVGSAAPAWRALLETARRVGAEVLVCGTRGRGAFARAVLGSTSSSVLHNADLPPLIVPDGAGALDGPVIAAYDGSQGARHAIDVAGGLLRGRAAIVVHAWEPVFRRELAARALAAGPVDDVREIVEGLHRALAEAADARTQEGVDAARAAGLDAVGETVESDDRAWRVVAAAAQAHGASVIVAGARGLGAARSALFGSVSSGLIQNAELPILVVPDAPAAAAEQAV